MGKLQVPMPVRGLSFDPASSEQPPITTRRAKNVRVLDPSTGQSRIGTRSGFRKFWTAALPERIDYTTAVPYSAPKVEYTQLTDLPNETTTPAELTEEQSITLRSFGRAMRGDFQGTLPVLLDDDRIQLYNRDLALLATITPPLKDGDRMEQALAVDEARRVYAASFSETGAGSKVFQWVQVEDPDRPEFTYYDLRWTLPVAGKVQEITAQAGGLWLTRNLDTGASIAHITKYGALSGLNTDQLPIEEWDKAVPYPIRDIGIGPEGDVYGCCPSNPNRGAAPDLGGLHTPTTSWTVHDLGWEGGPTINVERSAANRLHALVDAHVIPGAQHGQFISVVPDRRYVATRNIAPGGGQLPGNVENPIEYGDGPADYTNRPAYSIHNSDATHRVGPQYFAQGLAGLPALYFSGSLDYHGTGYTGAVLRGNHNTGPNFKNDTTGAQTIDFDSDATELTIDATWTPFTNISCNVGAFDDGVLEALVSCGIQVNDENGSGLVTVEIRATRDGLPAGSSVTFNLMDSVLIGGTIHALSFALPIGTALAGDYSLEARKINGGDTVSFGDTQATNYTLSFNELNPDQNGIAAEQQALVPGHSASDGSGDSWSAFTSWRIIDTTRIGVMCYQKGNVHNWAMLSNARVAGGTIGHSPGWVAFISNQMSEGDAEAVSITGMPPGPQWYGVSFDANSDITGNHAVIGLRCVRSTPNDTNTLQSIFRVNGRAAARFTIASIEAWGPTSTVVIGNKHRLTVPDPSDLFPEAVPWFPYDGFFATWETVLGYTSLPNETANDVPTTVFEVGGFPSEGGTASGSIDPTTYDTEPPNVATSYTASATEFERLEGGMAHDVGMGNILPNGTTDTTITVAPPYPDHPFGSAIQPPVGFAQPVTIEDVDTVLGSPRPIFFKLGASGSRFVWALNGSGLGTACVPLPGRFVATMGEFDNLDVGNETVSLRRIYDGGETYSLAEADGAWAFADPSFFFIFDDEKIVADSAGQIYWPQADKGKLVKHRGSTGEKLWTYVSTPLPTYTRQVVLDPDVPLWPETSDEEDRSPIFIYIAGGTESGGVLRKLRMVAETQVIGEAASPRRFQYLAVSGADLYAGEPGGVAAVVPGGSGLFDTDRTFFCGATLFEEHFLCDGRGLFRYKPLAHTVARLATENRGEPPKRPRLMAAYLGRLAVAHTQDDVSTVFMSAFGDPTDWNYYPLNPSATDAWNSTLGVGWSNPPDMITALFSLDDVLVIGGDHSIWKAVGDPRAGGRLHLVSSETGIAFGRTWASNTTGLVYVWGSRGGVWRLTRGTDDLIQAQRVAKYTIERELQDVNLATHRVEVSWDPWQEGLVAFPVPYPEVA